MKIEQLLKKELAKIKPSEKEFNNLKKEANDFCKNIENKLEEEVFIGGSLAKNTLLKKDKQDIDIFVRFSKNRNISKKLEKVVEGRKVKGSRDYFQVNKNEVIFEIVPVLRIDKPEKAKNVTDLSYFHVKHVKDKIEKKPELADHIRLAKHFCHANDCYGAESYINGFSGYALELLIIHYGSFIDFIKAMSKFKNKIILDPENHYENEKEILTMVNESKLQSPIVLIDPTYKKRNVLAALSQETLNKFKIVCKKFLDSPSQKFFEKREINPDNYNLILEAGTNKQKGDIAGSKLKKFFRVLTKKVNKYFKIKDKQFEYEEGHKARFYFKLEKKEREIEGPKIEDKKNVKKFKKKHDNIENKNEMLYAKEKAIKSEEFVKIFKKKFKNKMKDMDITSLKMVK